MRYLTALVVVVASCMAGCSSSVQQPQDVPGDVVAGDTGDDSEVVAPDVIVVDVRSDIAPDVDADASVDVPCDPQCGYKTCGPSACPDVICGTCDYGSCCSAEGQCTCCPGCDVAAECGDWQCGDSPCLDYDGIPIPCGICGVHEECSPWNHRCYPVCRFPQDFPTTWDRVGVVNYLHVPANSEEQAACFDFSGDGVGDCGISGLASRINPFLEGLIANAELALIFEFAQVNNFTATADFTLKGFRGAPVPVCDTATPPACTSILAGDMYLDPDSYTYDTCTPMIFFESSAIAEGKLVAGPNNFHLSLPLSADLLLTINLIDTQIKTGVLVADDTGVAAPDGVLSGVVTKAEINGIFDSLQVECDKNPLPEAVVNICPYLTEAREATATMYDLHQDASVASGFTAKDAENPGDAASICLHFTLAAANIVGYIQDQPN